MPYSTNLQTLPDRLGPVQTQPVPDFKSPQVTPLADIMKAGLENINNVLEKFGPLNRAQREAEIAKMAVVTHAFQLGAAGDTAGMAEIMNGIAGHQDPYTSGYRARSGSIQAAVDAGVQNYPHQGATTNWAAVIAKAEEARKKRAEAVKQYVGQQNASAPAEKFNPFEEGQTPPLLERPADQ